MDPEGVEVVSTPFGDSTPPAGFTASEGLACVSGIGTALEPPAAAARAESCPRFGGPLG